jgi:hypothetical protein
VHVENDVEALVEGPHVRFGVVNDAIRAEAGAQEDDLKQAATIVAAFAYHTAQRDAKLPRKPLQLAQPETVGSR